jgi:hypothetical protein
MMDTAAHAPMPFAFGAQPAREHSGRRLAAVAALVLVEALLIFVPLVVLGQAVNWPAGLDAPAAETLPLVAANEGAVRFGYLAYLAYSLLFLPVIALAVTALTTASGRLRTVARLAVALAAVSALARGIGISRWLTTMPDLAAQWQGAAPDTREILAIQFHAVNDFGGGIGELLGVSALGAGAVLCAALAIRELAPRWLTVFGVVAALAVATPMAELAGADVGALVTVGTSVVQFWFIAVAVVLFRRARAAR